MSWKLVYCKLAGRCLRKALLEYYEELTDAAKFCCGVCDSENDMGYISCTGETKLLVQAIQALGPKWECKLSEFLRGSNSSRLTEENKIEPSFGLVGIILWNGGDHSLDSVMALGSSTGKGQSRLFVNSSMQFVLQCNTTLLDIHN